MGGYVVGETFAGMVRGWRQVANLTQEELAERSGLSPRSIQNLERGRVSRPRRDSVRLLADALRLSGADRAAFEHAARLGTPTPIAPLRGRATVADNLRQLVSQTGRQLVDLRGLPHNATPEDVLDRLLTALGVEEPAEAVAV
ncbi:helix-turn-helix domain-containing protein [Actinophytocola sp. NPDC049390]|uniref:helix-turn-helix domain-containing protein n=1 Tax=Actinophytocola sp. NPDC049390 TaxID=3363894 RepID=UPI00378FE054